MIPISSSMSSPEIHEAPVTPPRTPPRAAPAEASPPWAAASAQFSLHFDGDHVDVESHVKVPNLLQRMAYFFGEETNLQRLQRLSLKVPEAGILQRHMAAAHPQPKTTALKRFKTKVKTKVISLLCVSGFERKGRAKVP